ncbi:hypothetical protein L218DRAFT_988275 [Marasmius fiardii PR-910]|nr:hypothetical protein L218DRAFT_988275 [Marasmius fiardii PR-910]
MSLSPEAHNKKSAVKEEEEPPNMEDLNHKLTRDYILKNEPFNEICPAYFPNPIYDLKPPIFEYGVALSLDEFNAYVDAQNLFPKDEPPPSLLLKKYHVLRKLNQQFGLKSTGITDSIPVTQERDEFPLILITVITNYRYRNIPREKLIEVVKGLRREFKRRPKWYLSYDNGPDLKEDYSVPSWKLDEVEAMFRKEGLM